MRTQAKVSLFALVLFSTLNPQFSTLFAQGTAFTYQGRLTDGPGATTGLYDLQFEVYDAASGGTQQGVLQLKSATPVSNGLFMVTLDFGPGIFTGPARWLNIAVRTNGGGAFTGLSPRQFMAPTPYAITAGGVVAGGLSAGTYSSALAFNNAANRMAGSFTGNGGGLTNVNAATLGGSSAAGFWKTAGNAGTDSGANFLGTTDNQSLALKVNGATALRLDPTASGPNLVGGLTAFRPTVIGANVRGAVVAGGAAPAGPVTGLGAGDYHAVFDSDGTIGGGFGNKVGTDDGDAENAPFATVSGGVFNAATNYASVVAGGDANLAGGTRSGILSGAANQALAADSVVGGGQQNLIQGSASDSVIGGGVLNRIVGASAQAVIAGGRANTITNASANSTISGGVSNVIQSTNSLIGGGVGNRVGDLAFDSVIAGGSGNVIDARANGSVIGGGWDNAISNNASFSVIAGGDYNIIRPYSPAAFIGGGFGNRADGSYAVVPGGYFNWALASASFAAGRRAKALHAGSFVWGDITEEDIASTDLNQFVIRARGGLQLDNGTSLYCGSQTRQMLNLWGSLYGIGVQADTIYFRTAGGDLFVPPGNFSWFAGGQHSDVTFDPGAPTRVYDTPRELMRLDGSGQLTVFGSWGNGVWGQSSSANGVQGNSSSSGASGVYGENTGSGFGVAGRTTGGGSAVFGDNASAAGWAGNFNGRVFVGGNQHFGSQTRQMLNLWGNAGEYGIGVQASTLYFRSQDGGTGVPESGFSWYLGGSHQDNPLDPNNGVAAMRLRSSSLQVRGSVITPLLIETSDRNAKKNFTPVNPCEVLDKVVRLPISRWQFTNELGGEHLGPMAQDFHAAFGVGPDDKHIAAVDADGVALAAIQGLNQKLEEKEARIKELESRLERLEQLVTPKE